MENRETPPAPGEAPLEQDTVEAIHYALCLGQTGAPKIDRPVYESAFAALERLRSRLPSAVPSGAPGPTPMILHCPECKARHVDVGEFATKPHHTHACQGCGMVWRPAIGPTVGVQFLPGFKNEATPPPEKAGEGRTCYIAIPQHSPEWGRETPICPTNLLAWNDKARAEEDAKIWAGSQIPHTVSMFREVVESPRSRDTARGPLIEDSMRFGEDVANALASVSAAGLSDAETILRDYLLKQSGDTAGEPREGAKAVLARVEASVLFEDYDAAMAQYKRSVGEKARKNAWDLVRKERLKLASRMKEAVPMPADPNHIYWLVWAVRQMVVACSGRDAELVSVLDQAKGLGGILAKYFAHIPDPMGSKAISATPPAPQPTEARPIEPHTFVPWRRNPAACVGCPYPKEHAVHGAPQPTDTQETKP